ncbi:MAG: NAD(P)H-hydrate dehydratase, partial [Methanobacteriota archaeon]
MEYINPVEMRVVDKNSPYFGVAVDVLMENAGRAVYEELAKVAEEKRTFTIISGTGNNGGDGFAAALHLHKSGYGLKVYIVGRKDDIGTEEARMALKNLEDAGVSVKEVADAGEIDYGSDIIVDALLGTGIKGEVRSPMKEVIEGINRSKAYVVSVDVPSGLGTETVVDADLVIALHMAKEGLEGYNTVVKDIGIPEKASTHVGPGHLIVNLRRDPASHKGANGRVLVVAGSSAYSGAPILTGLGAVGVGADLVTLFVPEPILNAARTYLPDFIFRGYAGDHLNPEAVKDILDFSRGQDVCVVGPGLGTADETGEALNSILKGMNIPVVLDADALKLVDKKALKNVNGVSTPHATEFAGLTGDAPPEDLDGKKDVVRRLAVELSMTVLFKSPVDIVASPEGRVKLNETGNAGMTVGGTGDALAGAVGGFIAQGMDNFTAACCAAFVN